MRALIQRVSSASVAVDGTVSGEIGEGLLIFLCVMRGDTDKKSSWLASKIANLRIFTDESGRLNRSLLDVGGSVLVVSQFTLSAQISGNRPSFSSSASFEEGKKLYEHFSQQLTSVCHTVKNGVFGANRQVRLINDGPITILLDTEIV